MGNDREDSCPTIAELGALGELPETDPRRSHLRQCPRCRSRLATYREFMAGEAECDAGVLADALDRLGAAVDREILGADGRPAEPVRLFHWRSPVVRGALAVAATLLIFIAVDGRWPGSGPQPLQLRSDRPEAAAGAPLQPRSVALADGGIELRWQPRDGADAYRIEILDAAFTVLAEVPVEADSALRLSASRLRELLPAPGAYVWVVVALAGGDEIVRSVPTAFVFGSDS